MCTSRTALTPISAPEHAAAATAMAPSANYSPWTRRRSPFCASTSIIRRLARADELLPKPMADNIVAIAAALEVLHWRGEPLGRRDSQAGGCDECDIGSISLTTPSRRVM